MKKLRNWLLLQFLPAWAKQSVYRENEQLKMQISEQQQQINQLRAYASGLEYALRRRVVIKNEVSK